MPILYKPFSFWIQLTGHLTNTENPNEIQHKVVFPQGLHCLLKLKQSSGGGGWCQSDYEDYPSFLAYGIKVSLDTCIGPD